jgi:hypothetical protein
VTDVNGQSRVSVAVALDAPDAGLNGTCTFSTATGTPSVDVNFSGGDSCTLISPSPVPPVSACLPDQFTVGGIVTGLTAAGPIILQNNNNSVVVTSNTSFTFPDQNEGSAYLVSVLTQPPGQTCVVMNGSGIVPGNNVTSVLVSCTP